MRKLKLIHVYPVLVLALITCVFVSIKVSKFKNTVDRVDFSITAVSIVIAIVAFDIAMRTYVSIDSVNAVNKMQGNVLENTDYVTSIPLLLKKYNMEDDHKVSERLYRDLEILFKKNSNTAIEFADNLQYFMDLIAFFPSLLTTSNNNQPKNIKKMNDILTIVDKRLKTLMAVSTGNLLLIEETVKLLKHVLNHQKLVNADNNNIPSSILEVRGNILKNPISKTVYYNYLGLYYRQKALDLIINRLRLQERDLYEINIAKGIINNIHILDYTSRNTVIMYLEEAQNAFLKAAIYSKDDIMWTGFISFNHARAMFFLQLFQDVDQQANWMDLMNTSIHAREKLNIIINDLLKDKPTTFFQKAFYFEEYFAKLINVNLCIASKKDIEATLKEKQYHYPHYEGILHDLELMNPTASISDRIHKYQQQLYQHLQENMESETI
ncbi:hypothetical protein OR571_11040 [Psychrobacillus sp. NEAU-3TGS]|uniref:hypothetical protein n=1 Tax=Psychrobacillus sp. NEAU-3TGS TaxID=2995412 RepID=UPI002495C8E3|nr:hypothetical protein [Psychrobacillus sp. NEAU-3TGS]MDI2587632.1 hypothetical protein [Psychrobacillus sp. NEAU-3TGS]